MLTRHQSRELVLQALFNLDFRKEQKKESKKVFKNIFKSFYAESEKEKEDKFAKDLFEGILEKKEDIDKELSKSTTQWDFNKTALIDKNILRMGYFEMFFSDKVPSRVAINEAIELSKTFAQKNSHKFISGVLGNIYEKSGLKDSEDNKVDKK